MSKREIIFDPIDSIIDDIERKLPIKEILKECKTLNKSEFDQLLDKLDSSYYNNTSLTTDENWDLLLDLFEQKFGKRKKIGSGGSLPNKVKLPRYMGSLDKKKDDKALGLWFKSLNTNHTSFVIMDKLDGISAYYENDNGKHNLFKRGNGTEGSDVSFLIPHLRLPTLPNGESVRGELVLKKAIFESKYSEDKATARNLVAGATNTKNFDKQIISNIDFVAFQHYGDYSQSEQLEWLEEHKFNTVYNYSVDSLDDLTEEKLDGIVRYRKRLSEYDMDGIVIAHDIKTELLVGENPNHTVAFKIQGTIGITKVVGVEWNLTQYGVYKPVVVVEPIKLDGVTISRASGFNAKYIEENKIGSEAQVVVERRNDVLPIIIEITIPTEPSFPTTPFVWNKTHVDITLPDGEINDNVNIQKIVRFFSELDIKFLAETTVEKIYNHLKTKKSYNPELLDFLSLKEEDLTGLEGFGEVLINKLISAIRLGITNVELAKVMSGSGVFGYGFATKKSQSIIDSYPDILEFPSKYTNSEIEDKIREIGGFNKIAKQFADNLENFNTFLINHPQINFVIKKEDVVMERVNGTIEKSIANLEFVFTGFRNHTLEKLIIQNGGKIKDGTVTKKTNILLVRRGDNPSTKEKNALKYNIPILTEEEFIHKFNIMIK